MATLDAGMTSPADSSDSSRRRRRSLSTGRFRVIADIGEGGMAYVQLAVAKGPSGFNKLVVLKALREGFSNEPEIAAMFRHEARLAARLNHPNVVQTYEVGEESGRQVMVMEYLEGQALSQLIRRAKTSGGLTRGVHLRVLCDALAGLHHAHDLADFNGEKLGIVHRDVSPQNVFVTYEGQVKVLDFGIAKAVNGAPTGTQVGVIKGKIRYMAPEQMEGEAIDRRADIFSVGVMLWEALTGEKLWSQISDVNIMNRVTNGEFPSLRAAAPDVPESLERICLKAMALRPEDRYEDAQAFQFDLEAAVSALGEEVKQREVGSVVNDLFCDTRAKMKEIIESQLRDASALASGPPPSLEEGEPLDNAAKSNAPQGASWRSVAFAVVLLGALAGGGAYWFVSKTHPPQPHPVATVVPVTTGTVAAPTTSALPADVDVRIAVTPPEARLTLDGSELPSNPYTGTLPRSDARHVLRAEASGYLATEVNLALDKNVNVKLGLVRAPEGTGHTRRPPKGVPAPKASASAAPPTMPQCTQPFFVDEQGIKRMRPECM